jgi:hypothetical protein
MQDIRLALALQTGDSQQLSFPDIKIDTLQTVCRQVPDFEHRLSELFLS